MSGKPLTGVRVLDIAHYLAGPYCSKLLAEMGAEVIRVERPGGGEDRGVGPHLQGESLFVLNSSQGKKAITLDLRSEKGRDIFKRLVRRADLVVENYRPGVLKAMGLGYEELKKVKESIILVSVSGFGQTGPYAERPCFDHVAQGYSGMVDLNGFPDMPPVKTGMSIADYSGGVYGALGAMFALFHCQRTGEGQHVDVALLDSMFSMLETSVMEYMLFGRLLRHLGNRRPVSSPADAYRAQDGYVYLIATPQKAWRALLKLMNREELAADPRYATYRERAEQSEIIESMVAKWVAGYKVAELIEMLVEAGIPCGPVNSVAQAIADPQIRHREMIVEVEHPTVGKIPFPGVVAKMSGTPGEVRRPPMVGEHNEDIYGGVLGLTADEMEALSAEGVI